jgi:hypothetical protein
MEGLSSGMEPRGGKLGRALEIGEHIARARACSLFRDGGLSPFLLAAARSSRGVRTQTGVKPDEAPDDIARETRMVKTKSYNVYS